MKYIKTFEQFVNESNNSVTEGADNKTLYDAFSGIADSLKRASDKEKDSDLKKTYIDDAADYRELAKIAKSDIKAAKKKFKKLDTLAQDYVADYLKKSAAKEVLNLMGYEMNESNKIVELENQVNEDHIDSRVGQINFITKNARAAGYPDLENEEFTNSLSDLAVENFYKMIELILTYNDSKL